MSTDTSIDTEPDVDHDDSADTEESTGLDAAAEKEPGATSSAQWRAASIQMVNWGGFQGAHRIDLHPGATLLSGASGTGKSTVMDAYIALMMPWDVPFNGASNDAVTGRSRSAGQRNVPSYLRGKLDDQSEAGTDELRARVLRGTDTPTWGAVGATFTSSSGATLTALRAWYLPRGATTSRDATMKMATIAGNLNLAELEDVAARRFDKRDMEKRFTGLKVTDKYGEFSQTLFTTLGIGAHGDGLKALRLLARIQAGHAVRTVDDLYKSMVLERPATYAAADRALEHFADLEAAWDAMAEEADRKATLEGIDTLHDQHQQATEQADLLDSLGATRDGDTPWLLWRLGVEAALLADAEARNSTERAAQRSAAAEAAAAETTLAARLAAIEADQRAAGGDAIEQIDLEIAAATAALDAAWAARADLAPALLTLDESLADADALTAAQDRTRAFLEQHEDATGAISRALTELGGARWPISNELAEVKRELESLTGRDGRVDLRLHTARTTICEAAGLDPADLPYAAELIDIPARHQQWRTAIETTLAGLARTLLIDATALEHVSARIDPIGRELGIRISFQGVHLTGWEPRAGDPEMISGKLDYKDTPYTHWVATRIASDSIDARCVPSPTDLAGSERRVTPSGQMRRGHSGAHGVSRAPHIIGFSSSERRAELEARRDELDELDRRHDATFTDLQLQQAHLTVLRSAHERIQTTTWESIDTTGPQARIAELTGAREAILASSDQLAALADAHTSTEKELEQARGRKHIAQGRLKDLEHAQGKLADDTDAVTSELDRLERTATVILTDTQRTALDEAYRTQGTPGSLEALGGDLRRIAEQATVASAGQRASATQARERLEATYRRYAGRWPDPDRGTTIADHDAYLQILETIRATGLAERRSEWTRRVTEWTGQDLVPLAGAFAASIEEIEDRLRPVNEILASLDFGARGHHLRITLRRLASEEGTAFQKRLRQLASGTTAALADEAVHERFTALRTFLNPLRETPIAYTDAAGRTRQAPASRRDALLDVRRHVKITAEALDGTGARQVTFDTLGEKSGGETQELVAFIVGAALRYQLGDEDATGPSYALVALDEAFIKADSEFTGRAISAWKGLGFQLLVGAPNEKVTGLEPHMDRLIAITKSPEGYSHATTIERTGASTA